MTCDPPEGPRTRKVQFQVVVMAKSPMPGRVKTRLCPPLGHVQAAVLARAALLDTLDAVAACEASDRILALEGSPGSWLPPSFAVVAQRPGDLGARLDGALVDAWARRRLPIVLIGMDTPQLSARLLDEVAAILCPDAGRAGPDAVIGGAEDGGYWVIGVQRPIPGLFDGVPMSTATTGGRQRRRLTELGARWSEVPTLRDVDDFDDALGVAAIAPHTRFAESLAPMVQDEHTLVPAEPTRVQGPVL